MNLGKLAVLGLALMFASAGVGAALADWRSPDPGPPIDLADARKDESTDATVADDDRGDGDDTNGNDGTGGGDNTRPAQRGDGDSTAGNDGTSGGDNTAPAPRPAAPADDSFSAHSVSRGSISGGGGTT